MGWSIDMERKGWVIHSWPWYWILWPWWGGWMYRIVTRVTSDNDVPSTYLVSLISVENDKQISVLLTETLKWFFDLVLNGHSWVVINVFFSLCCCFRSIQGSNGRDAESHAPSHLDYILGNTVQPRHVPVILLWISGDLFYGSVIWNSNIILDSGNSQNYP